MTTATSRKDVTPTPRMETVSGGGTSKKRTGEPKMNWSPWRRKMARPKEMMIISSPPTLRCLAGRKMTR